MRCVNERTIGPLHDPVTWYKIIYTGEQIAQWDFQNNAAAFVSEVPLGNLLTSIRNFVPRDRVVQRAYLTICWASVFHASALPCGSADCFGHVMTKWTDAWKTDYRREVCNYDDWTVVIKMSTSWNFKRSLLLSDKNNEEDSQSFFH